MTSVQNRCKLWGTDKPSPIFIGEKMTGEDIKALRKRRAQNQADFALDVGTTVTTIVRWEKGHSVPLPVFMKKLKHMWDNPSRRTS